VNGDRGVRAPPSPPIPTPPLHHSSDNGRDLSDLHITSPDGSVLPSGNFSSVTEDSPMEGSEQTAAEQSSTDAKADTGSAGEALRRADSSTHANNDQAMSDLLSKKSGRNREDDDGEDRPPKRAKTADAPDTNLMVTNNPSSAEFSGPLTAARTKFVIGVIRSLRRTKDARPFTMPVDAVRLNVPTYYDIIKHPMDLQTMERKLNNNEYSDLGSFISDFNQILKNCMTFNGPDHAVTFMSKSMEAAFYRHMKYLPSEDVVDVEKPKTAKKKGGGVLSGAAAVSARSAAAGVKSSAVSAKATPIAKPKTKKEPKSSVAHSPSATSPVFSLQPSGMPQIRRDSTAGDGRPKREIHPPAPKDLPYSTKPRRKQNAAELKFCDSILKELHKKAHEAYAFPFYHPVDPVALNIPDYFKVIKRPMDLSTVQDRLKMNAYENANEFEADIRLMFNNCYKFNPPSQAVHQMGRELEAVFDLKWSEKPSYSNNQGSRSPQTASPAPHDEDELSEEEEEETDEQQNIAELEKNLEKLKEQISAIKKGQKKKSPPAQSKSKPKGGGRKITSSTAAHTSHTKKTKPVPYVSMEQKTELSERINLLPPSKMHFALDMIKDNMPDIGNVSNLRQGTRAFFYCN
jgi:bromodomain-containing factor 1